MKTTTISKPVENTLETFESELARIESDRSRLARELEQSQRELATFAERARARDAQEVASQNAIDEARARLQEAQVRAELLVTGELAKAAKANLSPLERQMRTAQDSQLKTLNRLQQEKDADQRREAALQEAINRASVSLAHLNEREQITRSLRDKAFTEQGETKLRSCMDTLRAMEAQRDIQRSTLQNMEDKIESYIRMAIEELASFPAQQEEFTALFEYGDSLTGILQSQIDFIDLVLATGQNVEIPLEVTKKANVRYMGLPELLSIDAAHYAPALSAQHMKSPSILIERKNLLAKLLKTYREMK